MKTALAALALVLALSTVGCSSTPNCDKLVKCCEALSKTPNSGVQAASCNQIAQEKKLNSADQACLVGLQGFKGLKDAPAACQ